MTINSNTYSEAITPLGTETASPFLCNRAANLVGLLILLCTLTCLILFGLHQWPGLHWDAAFFAPPVINVGAHQEWSFGGYIPFLLGRQSPIYNFHGFLHVILFAKLFAVKTWSDYYFWIGVLNAFTVLVYAYLFYRSLERNGVPSLLYASILSFLPAVLLLGVQGRPEHIVFLLVALPFLVFELWRRLDMSLIVAYACCGLILITSPLVGLAAGVIILVGLLTHASRDSSRAWLLRQIGLFLMIGAAVAIITTELFTPFNFFSWIMNVVMEGEGPRNIDFEGLLSQYYLHRYGRTMFVPGFNLLVSVALFIVLCVLIDRQAFLPLILVIASGLYFNKRMNDYGYVAFLPILLCIALDRVRFPLGTMLSKIRYRYLVGMCIMVGSLYFVILAQYSLMALVFRFEGPSLADSRSYLQSHIDIDRQGDQFVSIGYPLNWSPSLVVLGDAGVNFVGFWQRSTPPSYLNSQLLEFEEKFNTKVKYYILPLPSYTKTLDIPDSVYLGDRRYDFLASEAAPLKGALANLLPLSRPLLFRHHAYHYAIYKAPFPSLPDNR